MKSLLESILSKSKVGIPKNVKEVTSIDGERFFKAKTDKKYPDLDITSNRWTKIDFISERWEDRRTAWFCPESKWILYSAISAAGGISAVAPPGDGKVYLKDFARFDNMLIEGESIAGMLQIKTNLPGIRNTK